MVEEKVREGYKKTEVGVIPDEWDIKTVRNICEIYGRIGFRGYTVNDIVAKGYGAISLSPSNIIDDKLDTTKCTYISWYKYEESPEIKIYNGDVLLVKTGSTYGKVACVSGLNEKATINPQLVVFKNIKVNNIYFGYLMNSKVAKEQINSAIVGGAIPTLSQEQIYNFIFPIPNDINEQKGIADALNGVDKLLQSLEKLIEKKKKIKQGTIQQLLTGKKRLPGFSDEWEVKKLIELGYFVSGNGFPIIYQELNEGEFPFYKVSDFNNIGNEIYMIRANNYIDEQIREKLSAKIIPKNSIIFAKIGAAIFLERKRISSVKCCIDNNMMSYICDVNYLYEKFAYYLYNSIKLSSLVSATALPSLSAKDIGELKINIPINIDEQKAIANILTVMDSEIATLQQKLEKYKRIKQGMMQELLTGRIRLV